MILCCLSRAILTHKNSRRYIRREMLKITSFDPLVVSACVRESRNCFLALTSQGLKGSSDLCAEISAAISLSP